MRSLNHQLKREYNERIAEAQNAINIAKTNDQKAKVQKLDHLYK